MLVLCYLDIASSLPMAIWLLLYCSVPVFGCHGGFVGSVPLLGGWIINWLVLKGLPLIFVVAGVLVFQP